MDKSAANRFGGPFIPEPIQGLQLPQDLFVRAEDVAMQCRFDAAKIRALAEQRYLLALDEASKPGSRAGEPRYVAERGEDGTYHMVEAPREIVMPLEAARDAVAKLFHDLHEGLVDEEGTRVDLRARKPLPGSRGWKPKERVPRELVDHPVPRKPKSAA